MWGGSVRSGGVGRRQRCCVKGLRLVFACVRKHIYSWCLRMCACTPAHKSACNHLPTQDVRARWCACRPALDKSDQGRGRKSLSKRETFDTHRLAIGHQLDAAVLIHALSVDRGLDGLATNEQHVSEKNILR